MIGGRSVESDERPVTSVAHALMQVPAHRYRLTPQAFTATRPQKVLRQRHVGVDVFTQWTRDPEKAR
jgi:hypothetical protein